MKIGSFDTARRVLVVAEAGNNHEGSLERAKELVKRAAACGAGAVKFQTYATERFVSPTDSARLARLKSFELPHDAFRELSVLARSLGLLFISTPLDLPSADFLAGVVDAFKIASGDNDFYPLISRAASHKKPLILSTGLSSAARLKPAVAAARRAKEVALLHCVCSYPVEPAQANLRGIEALKKAFPKLTVGYSDHTLGIEAAVLAVALGARIVEKHFTLDKNLSDFRDHKLSADPAELSELARRVAQAEALLGRPAKEVQPCEEAMIPLVRRSISAAADLPAGHRVKAEDILWLRPIGEFRPGQEKRVVGKTLTRAVSRGQALAAGDLK